jgi:hypothetical protein
MKIIKKGISISQLRKIAKNNFGNLVKAVIDVDREIMAIDADLHSDEEAFLLKNGSKQKNLWGINLFPNNNKDFIEFDSMINLRPTQNNMTRGVDNLKIRMKIISIVNKLIKR